MAYKIIKEAHENPLLRKKMLNAKKLYGNNVSKKIISAVNGILKQGPLFEWLEHERLGLSKLSFWEKGDLDW